MGNEDVKEMGAVAKPAPANGTRRIGRVAGTGIGAMDAAQQQRIRTRIAQCIQELPALPVVVARVLEETQRPNVSASDLENLIGSDQALAAKTLRIVNSAYYGMSRQIESISQAVVILGIQQIRNLVLSIGAMGAFRSATPRQRQAHQRFWAHAIATACACQVLAKKARVSTLEQEVSFVAGLMHDLGRLFLFTNFTDTYMEIDEAARAGRSLAELERQVLGLTHSEVGEVLARGWKLPDRLAELMGEHDGPFFDHSNTLGMIVHVSHLMAEHLCGHGEAWAGLDPVAGAWLEGLQEDREQIRTEVEARLYGYECAFGLAAA